VPVDGGLDIQPQYSDIGDTAVPLHIGLIWVMAAISLFVLFLLLYVMIRFRRSKNPVPSRTSHNTLIEIIWTVVPVLILVIIAVPSIILLRDQYEAPPEDALTIKATAFSYAINSWPRISHLYLSVGRSFLIFGMSTFTRQ